MVYASIVVGTDGSPTAERAVAAAQRAAGNRPGARATLDAVLGRFRDRPLAFVAVVRDELRDLED